ncbi:putative nucleic acid-binding protein [Curtobacterium flaccumfaciens]|uniref:Putative nucleic acid-binding protein n=1 Tax=Curtobacterium flaccumfaciens TaxID=2035 RepID=A0A4R6DNC0_9MICO|nr:PIN domain-containing protein [Curtobacterium flaccumfaciens]TDN46367.1 putative nucleic acid-binding protein [Curtobacterium flaccumfaciens]
MAFPVFFDACAIYGITLSDLLLRLADEGAYRPLWSDEVLDEVRRNAVDAGILADGIDRRLGVMRTYFPDALVTGHDDLVDGLTCDEKDRHVLAAAIRAKADALVTFNLRDLPAVSLEPFDVEVVHPDVFLLDQLDLYPGMVTRVLRELSEDYADPPQSVEDILGTLRRGGVPRFSDEVRRYL